MIEQNPFSAVIREQTQRALWECENLLRAIPDALWDRRYDGIPMWKYVYHTLYSMDRWYINPGDPDYRDPSFHTKGLNDLNVVPSEDETLPRETALSYFVAVKGKLCAYLDVLQDDELTECPADCDMTRFHLILGQFRHWHRHMGLIYGFLIEDTGNWPFVLNQLGAPPEQGEMPFFYD